MQIYSEILNALKAIKDEMDFAVSGNYLAKEIIRAGNFSEKVCSIHNFVKIPTEIGSFSIISRVYEAELNQKYGIELVNLINGKRSGFNGNLKKNVSFNGGYNQSSKKINKKILKKYVSIPSFCSMLIDSEEELLEHVMTIYELSYNHYVWAKENNLEGQFPNYCCGSSSRNLFLTLLEKGYPNSSFLYNSRYDHAYVALPFVFGKDNENGFIVIDPTSDQLFNDKTNVPRNNLFVVFGTKWVYETNWENESNLYPSSDDNSTFANLYTLRNNLGSHISEQEGIDEYFSEIFKNFVNVTI